MILHFYVQGRPLGSDTLPSESYIEAVRRWTEDLTSRLSDLSWDEAVAWSKQRASFTWDETKRTFKYLIGSPTPPSPSVDSVSPELKDTKREKGGAWQLTGMFSSLKGAKGGPTESRAEAESRAFTEGEVHADLIRVCCASLAKLVTD